MIVGAESGREAARYVEDAFKLPTEAGSRNLKQLADLSSVKIYIFFKDIAVFGSIWG